jgi:hypothetical protein
MNDRFGATPPVSIRRGGGGGYRQFGASPLLLRRSTKLDCPMPTFRRDKE